jgi:hypothetical protein
VRRSQYVLSAHSQTLAHRQLHLHVVPALPGTLCVGCCRFTHGAAVHSAFDTSRMGQQKRSNARLWLSTGKSDGNFPPNLVRRAMLLCDCKKGRASYRMLQP